MDKTAPQRVAIIGSGLAGLSTAHLLHASASYAVTIFEQSPQLALDAASISVARPGAAAAAAPERIDLPMRALAGGYYTNVLRMYAHLGLRVHPVRFLFVFALAAQQQQQQQQQQQDDAPYFVHASNLHGVPPRPPRLRPARYLLEVLFLAVCHAWFSAACFLVAPAADGESLGAYTRRIWLPWRYVSHYLLPLMSAVATCSHAEMLAAPAGDVVAYRRRSTGHQHYLVCGGVRRVQAALAAGIADVRLRARVVSVEPGPAGVRVRWRIGDEEDGEDVGQQHHQEEVFDRVVLAVSPDVVARLFRPAEPLLRALPTRHVETAVLAGQPSARTVPEAPAAPPPPPHVITLRTRLAGAHSRTEALHALPSGVLVQTCPLDGAAGEKCGGGGGVVLRRARFTRTLRTVESQRAVRRLLGGQGGAGGWTNGQHGVWLVGAWCWDGMVLLEGCVVSAMAVARDFGVRVPWDGSL